MTAAENRRTYRFAEHGHAGYRNHWYARPSEASTEIPDLTLNAIVNRDNFVRTFKIKRNQAGSGGGIDGFSYLDFTISEVGDIADEICNGIHTGTWLPHRSRCQLIPKSDGRGKRQLDIRCVMDRLVSSAVTEVIVNKCEEFFLPSSYGFRPDRNVQGLLAVMAHTIEQEGTFVVAQDDVANAFPSVKINDSVCDYAAIIDDPGLLNLIEVILRGYSQSQVGIEQGDPLSPPTLNLRLHNCLDLPSFATTGSDIALRYRYADNLVYLCRSVSEGQRAIESDGTLLLQSGFRLKSEKNYPVDLRRSGSSITFLGYVIRLEQGSVKFDLSNKAFQNLSIQLERAHTFPNSASVAESVITGWIMTYGPVFESYGVERYLRKALCVAIQHEFREIGSYEYLCTLANSAVDRWRIAKRRSLLQFLLLSRLQAAPQPFTSL